MIALSPVLPRSITIPLSFEFELAPLFNSIRLSDITVFVVATVVVVPFTVRLPVTVKLPPMASICASISVTSLLSAALRFVPPAPSSTTIKSVVARSAPISLPPSMSRLAIAKPPALAPTKVLIRLAAILRLVPPAPLSTIKRSASASASPMSAPPSISMVVISPS